MALLLDAIRKSPHRNQLERTLTRLLPSLSGRVLDIGSRNRRYDYLLKEKPVAIDIVASIEKDIQQGDVTAIPFADHSFDAVLCIEVLEYVDNPAQALSEMYRVLAPGGTLVLSVPFMFKVHDDRMRFTGEYLRELCGAFASVNCMTVGNAYIVMLTILWGKIKQTRWIVLRYLYTILVSPFLLLAVIARQSTHTQYPTGYIVVCTTPL